MIEFNGLYIKVVIILVKFSIKTPFHPKIGPKIIRNIHPVQVRKVAGTGSIQNMKKGVLFCIINTITN